MTGKVIIVTGGNSGLGFEISKYLAEGGNDVVLACRNVEKGEEAVTKIKTQYPSALVQCMEVDLCSTTSVKNFAKDFMRSKRKLNVLINNAGKRVRKKENSPKLTSEGLEYTMSSNYFGHFLLTHSLLDYISQTASFDGECRIINITCSSHNNRGKWFQKDLQSLDPQNMQLLKLDTYTNKQAYKNSKLCGILFTYKLAHEVKQENITVVAVDPGYLPATNLHHHPSSIHRILSVCCLNRCLACSKITGSIRSSAMLIVDLATSEKYNGVTGKYYHKGQPSRSSLESYDLDLQKSVWKDSCRLLKIRGSMAASAAFDDLSMKSFKDESVV